MSGTQPEGATGSHLDREWRDGISLSQREYARIFCGGRVVLMVSTLTRGLCLCPDCLTTDQKRAMREWLESIQEPPPALLETAGRRKVEP